jgi:hypothetical protein
VLIESAKIRRFDMDYSPESSAGQQSVIISAALVAQIAHQCDSLQMLRAWYGNFEPSIRQVDATANIKAYDLIVDGAVSARQVARELGLTLPDVSSLNWDLTPRPERPSTEL